MNQKAMKSLAVKQVHKAGKAAYLATLVFLLSSAALILLRFVPELLDNYSGSGSLSHQISIYGFLSTFSYLFTISLTLVSLLLEAGYAVCTLNILNNGAASIKDLLGGFRLPGKVIVLGILRGLFCSLWTYAGLIIPMTVFLTVRYGQSFDEAVILADLSSPLGTAAVAGIVILLMFIVQYRYRLALFLLLEHPELSPSQALRSSVLLTRGHRFSMFLLDLSFLPWLLLSFLTCGVLLVWKLPWFGATWVAACHSLQAEYTYRAAKRTANIAGVQTAFTPAGPALNSSAGKASVDTASPVDDRNVPHTPATQDEAPDSSAADAPKPDSE